MKAEERIKPIVTICWSAEDIKARKPKWSYEKCADWLDDNAGYIEDRSIEIGHEVIDTLMAQEN